MPALFKLIWNFNLLIFGILVLFYLLIVIFSFLRQRHKEKFSSTSIWEREDLILPKDYIYSVQEIIRYSPLIHKGLNEVIFNAKKAKRKWRRIEAIILLGCLKVEGTEKILEKFLDDKDDDIVYSSMLALRQLGTKEAARILLNLLLQNRFSGYKIVSLLEQFPVEIVDEIFKNIKTANLNARFWLIKLIAKFKPQQYLKDILSLINDSSSDVRAATCECLGYIGQPLAIPALTNCLADEAWVVRMYAIRALDKIYEINRILPDSEIIVKIINLLKDEVLFVREAAVNFLGKNFKLAINEIFNIFSPEEIAKNLSIVGLLVKAGYIKQLLEELLSEDFQTRQKAFQLFKNLIDSGVYFSFAKNLLDFDEERRKKILDIGRSINPEFILNIEKTLK